MPTNEMLVIGNIYALNIPALNYTNSSVTWNDDRVRFQ
jgi:alanine-alpha-ketoisovalerate/valine-pyruvate aminotransferase